MSRGCQHLPGCTPGTKGTTSNTTQPSTRTRCNNARRNTEAICKCRTTPRSHGPRRLARQRVKKRKQVKREFYVRGQHKGAPSPATHLREAAHKGTYYPTQRVGPLKGFTKYLREAVHITDLLPTRKAGGPTIGILHNQPKGVAEQSKQQDATHVSEETGALSRSPKTARPPRKGMQPAPPKRQAP